MTVLKAWVDGRLYPADRARVSVYDRGFRSGEGVFETLRAYGEHPFRLAAHLERAVTGAGELGFELDATALTAAVHATVDANLPVVGGADTAVRLTISAGLLDPDSSFPGTAIGGPTVVVTSHRLPASPRTGATGWCVPLARELPHVKAVSYLVAMTARRRAQAAGADEALLTTEDGRLLEGAASNLFMVRDGVLATPPVADGLLAGVTRQVVLEVAAELGIEVEERALHRRELALADEALLTATTREVVPLLRIDGAAIGTAHPGPLTAALQRGLRAVVERERTAARGSG